MRNNLPNYKSYMAESREFQPIEKGEGLLQRSIAKYTQLIIKDNHKDNKNIKGFYSIITPFEEEIFNDKLFYMIQNEKQGYEGEIYADLIDLSRSVNKSVPYVSELLKGICGTRVKITDGKGWLSISSIFTGIQIGNPIDYETGKCIETDYYFSVGLNPIFLKACSEIWL